MTVLAKITALVIIVKGLVWVLFPAFPKKTADMFNNTDNSKKRITGLVCFILGLMLFYFTRIYLTAPLVHWVVALTGIYMVMLGIAMLVIPGVAGKIAVWFYREKEQAAVTGIVLSTGGAVLYILL
jgi:uncharacterized protein YjeT (DUF2065 family)